MYSWVDGFEAVISNGMGLPVRSLIPMPGVSFGSCTCSSMVSLRGQASGLKTITGTLFSLPFVARVSMRAAMVESAAEDISWSLWKTSA